MTAFLESEALLAVAAGDDTRAIDLMRRLTGTERATLGSAARRLAEIADPANYCVGCDKFVPVAEGVTRMNGRGVRGRWCEPCDGLI